MIAIRYCAADGDADADVRLWESAGSVSAERAESGVGHGELHVFTEPAGDEDGCQGAADQVLV